MDLPGSLPTSCHRMPLPSLDLFSCRIPKGGKQWNAAKLLEKMKSLGLRPNKCSYDTVIHACRAGAGGEWRLALDLLDDMRRSGLTVRYRAALATPLLRVGWVRRLCSLLVFLESAVVVWESTLGTFVGAIALH